MTTVAELIAKLEQCPREAKVLFAEQTGTQEARLLSADVYGAATATQLNTDSSPESVVVLTCSDPSPDQVKLNELAILLGETAIKLDDMKFEKERWLNRVLKLERRLDAVREAITLEKKPA